MRDDANLNRKRSLLPTSGFDMFPVMERVKILLTRLAERQIRYTNFRLGDKWHATRPTFTGGVSSLRVSGTKESSNLNTRSSIKRVRHCRKKQVLVSKASFGKDINSLRVHCLGLIRSYPYRNWRAYTHSFSH